MLRYVTSPWAMPAELPGDQSFMGTIRVHRVLQRKNQISMFGKEFTKKITEKYFRKLLYKRVSEKALVKLEKQFSEKSFKFQNWRDLQRFPNHCYMFFSTVKLLFEC